MFVIMCMFMLMFTCMFIFICVLIFMLVFIFLSSFLVFGFFLYGSFFLVSRLFWHTVLSFLINTVRALCCDVSPPLSSAFYHVCLGVRGRARILAISTLYRTIFSKEVFLDGHTRDFSPFWWYDGIHIMIIVLSTFIYRSSHYCRVLC